MDITASIKILSNIMNNTNNDGIVIGRADRMENIFIFKKQIFS